MKNINVSLWVLGLSIALIIPRFTRAQAPQRTSDNLIVASYNIKWLGHSNHDYTKLAQVISNFDVCGILEIKDEDDLSEIVQELDAVTGEEWNYVCGLRTHRPGGNYYEAYGAIWRTDRAELDSGMVSNVWNREEVYRNDPFLVSFKQGNFDFTLLLIHTRWSGDADGNRQGEVAQIWEHLSYIRDFSDEKDFILMGDFNYPGTKDVMIDMAVNADLVQIDQDEKTTYKLDCTDYANPYDHIYINQDATLDHEYINGSCKVLDVTELIYGDNSVDNMRLSKSELSDHLPVYAIFDTSKTDDD